MLDASGVCILKVDGKLKDSRRVRGTRTAYMKRVLGEHNNLAPEVTDELLINNFMVYQTLVGTFRASLTYDSLRHKGALRDSVRV